MGKESAVESASHWGKKSPLLEAVHIPNEVAAAD
jgi:hypothetical protein